MSSMGTGLPWSASVLVMTTRPVPLGPGMRVEQSLGEIAGRQQIEQAELVLPADAIGLKLGHEVDYCQVTPELLAGRRRREILATRLAPVKMPLRS